MATRNDLRDWVLEALKDSGGSARRVEVFRLVWKNHEHDLRSSGDLMYTWQYDINWAATQLRHDGLLKSADVSPRGVWELP
jgi:hypothetical protein